MTSYGNDGKLFTMLGLTPDDVMKPEFATKVKRACDRDATKTRHARAILLDKTAVYIYLKLGVKSSVRNILELDQGPQPPEVIKKALRNLQMRVHPDKWRTGDCEILNEFAKECSQYVNGLADLFDQGELRLDNDYANGGSEAEEASGDVDSDAERREFYDDKKKKKRKSKTKEPTRKRHKHGVEEAATVRLTLRELLRGVPGCEIKLLSGGSMNIRVAPGTVPGWTTVIYAPGRPPIRVTVEVKPESMQGFTIDDRKRLCVDVDVPMTFALCGEGTIEAESPDGSRHTLTLSEPIADGATLLFQKGGFGGEGMVGIARIVNPSSLLTSKERKRIWHLIKGKV